MPDLRVRALQLLTRRDYSRAELQKKLAAHAESAEELASVLDTLQGERLLSDHRYATQRVTARAGRYGDARLKQELRLKGVILLANLKQVLVKHIHFYSQFSKN